MLSSSASRIREKAAFELLPDLKMALSIMRTAAHTIMPWNFALDTLDLFLNSVDFGANLLANRPNSMTFLGQFIDEVLLANAERWVTAEPFMSFQDISNKWVMDTTHRLPPLTTTSTSLFEGRPVYNPSPELAKPRKRATRRRARNTPPRFVCKKFNQGTCEQQAERAGHVAPWDATKSVRHLCLQYLPKEKRYCLKRHAKMHHFAQVKN
jgi:hypothetical protein